MVVEIFIIHRLRTAATALQAISFCFNWYCWSAGYCSAGCCHPAAHRPMPTSLPINLSGAQTAADLFFFFFFLNFIYFLYSRFLLVIYFIHISVYMSMPISQFITPPPPRPPPLSLLGVHLFFSSWLPLNCQSLILKTLWTKA